MATIEERMTLEAFLALPEAEPALEYEDGEVVQKVPPQGQHGWVQGVLVALINDFASTRKMARAIPELRTTYGGFSRVPDLAVYVWDRIPRDSRGRVANEFREPPDIAIEIVSPGQGVNSLVRRCLWYVGNGVRIALLVDPADDSVLLFRPSQATVALHGEDRVDLDEVLPGFELHAHEIFDSLSLD